MRANVKISSGLVSPASFKPHPCLTQLSWLPAFLESWPHHSSLCFCSITFHPPHWSPVKAHSTSILKGHLWLHLGHTWIIENNLPISGLLTCKLRCVGTWTLALSVGHTLSQVTELASKSWLLFYLEEEGRGEKRQKKKCEIIWGWKSL